MSLYEILAVLALVAAGGYAYALYRADLRRKPPSSQDPAAAPPPDQLMFGRAPQQRSRDRGSKEAGKRSDTPP